MKRLSKLRTLALAAAGAAVVSVAGIPPIASATGPAIPGGPASVRGGWSVDDPYDWYHPEWGPGWNNGYPAPGWVPPPGWQPPNDWTPPRGWSPPPNYGPPASWYHPEWGPGWNNGYPAPGWVPPPGWQPPNDWVPPQGWSPPANYAPPQSWVGPCTGPLADLLHPARCMRF